MMVDNCQSLTRRFFCVGPWKVAGPAKRWGPRIGGIAARIVEPADGTARRWRLVDVVEAAQMNTVSAEIADVEHSVSHRLKFDRQAVLNAVRQLVILRETYDGGGSEKTWDRICRIVWIASGQQVVKSLLHRTAHPDAASKSPELADGIEIVFLRTEFGVSTARGFLARQQRRGNDAVEEADSSANYEIPAGSKAVGNAETGIDTKLRVQHTAWPRLPIASKAEIDGQVLRRAPIVLCVQAAIGVIESANCPVTYRVRVVLQLKDRRVKGRLGEVRSLKTLKEEHDRIMILKVGDVADRPWIRRVRIDAKERRLKWVEQWKGFGGADPVVVTANAESVLTHVLGEVVNQFEAGLTVKVRVAAIHPDGELVTDFHVRDPAESGEVVVAMLALHARFIDQRRCDGGGQIGNERVVFVVVVLET